MALPESFGFAGLLDIAVGQEQLLGGVSMQVDNATVYSNVAELQPAFGRHLYADIYTRRACSVDPIHLVRLDPDTTLHGGGEFLVTSRGRMPREQLAPYLADKPDQIRDIRSQWRPVVRVSAECLLIARFGIYTWGHWLAEILPKLVLVEARYPGRFRFALPHHVLTDGNPHNAWSRIRESLSAYGIADHQILGLQPEMDYRFDSLFAVTDVWSDYVMHPGATLAMRARLVMDRPPSLAATAPRLSVERISGGRMLANGPDIRARLEARGFVSKPIGTMSFLQQVTAFQSASVVFGVLGSDLTGLLYAREGIKVISVAPAIFGDRFFYALILDRKGFYADLRGEVTAGDETADHRSTFHIQPEELNVAMLALGEKD